MNLFERLKLAVTYAHRNARVYGTPNINVITEVIMVPKYASVGCRREWLRLKQHPKQTKGKWLREVV